MNREPVLEQQFKQRYNRTVEVHRDITLTDKGLPQIVKVVIKYKGLSYSLTEYLTPDLLTDYVVAGIGEKEHKYSDYLTAEVHVADSIGEQDGNSI
jgi:hypothetical protein